MAAPTSFRRESLRTIAPWLLATAAVLTAFVLLSMFIDTLHLSMQRGEALRATLATQGTTALESDTRAAPSGLVARSD